MLDQFRLRFALQTDHPHRPALISRIRDTGYDLGDQSIDFRFI